MNDPTTIELGALFAVEHESAEVMLGCRTLLDRTVQLIAAERGVSYLDAFELVERARDGARAAGGTTLGAALRWLNADAYVGETLTLLDGRDRLAAGMAAQDLGPRTDKYNRVLLDADQRRKGSAPVLQTPDGVDVASALADPIEAERRYQRARAVQPGRWDGDQGRVAFASADRQHFEAGFDLVASAELPFARPAGAAAMQKLDRQIAKAAAKRAELIELSKRVDGMDAPASVRDAARRELDVQLARVNRKPLRLLEKQEAKLRLLDSRSAGKKPKRAAAPDVTRPPVAPALRMLEGGGRPGPQPAASHLAGVDFDARVRARMRELGAGEAEYPRVLEQLLDAEGA